MNNKNQALVVFTWQGRGVRKFLSLLSPYPQELLFSIEPEMTESDIITQADNKVWERALKYSQSRRYVGVDTRSAWRVITLSPTLKVALFDVSVVDLSLGGIWVARNDLAEEPPPLAQLFLTIYNFLDLNPEEQLAFARVELPEQLRKWLDGSK